MQLTQLEATVERELVRHDGTSSRFLLAVSGGIDSVALLGICARITSRNKEMSFEVAHVDHALRPQSTDDAMHVRALAQKLNLSFHLKRLGACPDGENFENWARQSRYQFLEEVRAKQNLDLILTAHHADDLTETFLMRLLSNKDPRGIDAFDPKRKIIRPLLNCERSELEAFVRFSELETVHDSSNDDTSYLRNRVRHHLIPFISEHFGASAVRSLRHRAEVAASDLAAISGIFEGKIALLDQKSWGSQEWRDCFKLGLDSIPDEMKWRFVEEVLKPKMGFRVGMMHARRALEVLTGQRRAAELPAGWCLESKSGTLNLFNNPKDS